VLLDVHPGPPPGWRAELAQAADLLLGDSALGDEPGAAAPLWDRIAREGTSRTHDLAWARLNPWRETLAALFDEPRLAASLQTLEELDLAHGSGPEEGPSAPALLLAGWMAARLHWAPERKEGQALRLEGARGPVRVRFQRDPADGTRSVSRVRLRAAAPHPLELEIVRHGRDPRASIRIDEPAVERREVPFPYREFAACIVGEIHRHDPNPALAEAVSAAQALLRAWTGSP
jgi:glucose-6-phosphate dehydrogenase assembly protein OpcA